MMRLIAPSGTPLPFSLLYRGLKNIAKGRDVIEEFRSKICERFSVRHCFFTSTGRAAMVLILKSLAQMSEAKKTEVIIPSYTCYSVPSSIIKAGLKVRILDIKPTTLDYDYNKLTGADFDNVLAIISSNLYGIPNNLSALENLARERNIFLLDDAAQAMGAKTDEQFCGTFGVAGIYSLDKGKNITSIDGGIIVTNSDDLAELIKIELTHLETLGITHLMFYVLKLMIYSVFLHPNLYWIPDRIPFLKLGKTIYSTDYPLATYSKLLASIGNELFTNLDQITGIRVSNARKIEQFILNHKKICRIKDSKNSKPVFLRYPVLVSDQSIRDQLIQRFRENGIGATGSYPASLAEIEAIKPSTIVDLQETPGGIKTSRSILTFPTHAFLKQSDFTHIKSILSEFDS